MMKRLVEITKMDDTKPIDQQNVDDIDEADDEEMEELLDDDDNGDV